MEMENILFYSIFPSEVEVYNQNFTGENLQWLERCLEKKIGAAIQKGAKRFLIGGISAGDRLAAITVSKIAHKLEKEVKLQIVYRFDGEGEQSASEKAFFEMFKKLGGDTTILDIDQESLPEYIRQNFQCAIIAGNKPEECTPAIARFMGMVEEKGFPTLFINPVNRAEDWVLGKNKEEAT